MIVNRAITVLVVLVSGALWVSHWPEIVGIGAAVYAASKMKFGGIS